MIKNYFLLFILLAFHQLVFSQNEKNINGIIVVKDATPQGVHIINLNNEKEVITDDKGSFTILAKPNDLLVFSSNHLDYFRKIVEEKDFTTTMIVAMTSKIVQLDEVEVIQYPHINALDLGIISKPAKKYSVAERRLYAESSTPVDALLNLISGRKANLEKDIEIEKKEVLLKKLDGLFEVEFYQKELGIANENIKGFHYFVIEDKKFQEAVNAKNKVMIGFQMIPLASKYKALAKSEK